MRSTLFMIFEFIFTEVYMFHFPLKHIIISSGCRPLTSLTLPYPAEFSVGFSLCGRILCEDRDKKMLHLYEFTEGSYKLLWSKPCPDQVDPGCAKTISPHGSIIALSSEHHTDRLMFTESLNRVSKESVDSIVESVDGVTPESVDRVSQESVDGVPKETMDRVSESVGRVTESMDRVYKESVDRVTESVDRVSDGLPGRPIAALDGHWSVVCKRSGEKGSVGISF